MSSSRPGPKKARQRLLVANDPHPMRIYADVAKEIGLNESIVLMQIEFLISISGHDRDGKLWTYQSLREMRDKYFKWWSLATISRVIKNLEKAELIHVDNHNKSKFDRTQWFALNEKGFEKLASVRLAILQDEKSSDAECNIQADKMQNRSVQDETTIPENTSETTTEITEEESGTSATPQPPPSSHSPALSPPAPTQVVSGQPAPPSQHNESEQAVESGSYAKEPDAKSTLKKRARAPTAPDPTAAHPAVVAHLEWIASEYDREQQLWPTRSQRRLIAEAITDLERWRRALLAWSEAGHLSKNVRGQLEWYHRGERPRQYTERNGTGDRTSERFIPGSGRV